MGRVYQQQFNPDGWLVATIAPNLTTGGAGDMTTTIGYGYNLDGVGTSVTTPNGGTTTEQHYDPNLAKYSSEPTMLACTAKSVLPVCSKLTSCETSLVPALRPR